MDVAAQPEVLSALYRAGKSVDRKFRRHFPSLADDLLQEAYAAGLRSAPRLDPSRGSPEAFFYTYMAQAAGQFLRRALSPATITKRMADGSQEFSAFWSVPDVADRLAAKALAPDEELVARQAHAEAAGRAAALRVRWRREVERATRHLPGDVRAAGELSVGLDGPKVDAAGVAAALEIWREDAERLVRKYRRALRAAAVAKAERALLAAEAELP